MTELILLSGATTSVLLGYGLLIGVKHAAEADHLAAVSTIVAREKGILRSASIGAVWGLGHTISVLVAGAVVLLLNFQISETTERFLEFCVGVMLTILGINVLRKLTRPESENTHDHQHSEPRDGSSHEHAALHPTFGIKPLIVGMIHGLAGSAALMLMVIPLIDSKIVGFLYLAVFGIGSILGMAIMTMIVSLPFQIASVRSLVILRILQAIAGVASCLLGIWVVAENLGIIA